MWMALADQHWHQRRRVVTAISERTADLPPCPLQNKMNINDWSAIQTLVDKLNKQLEKSQKVTEALGAPR
jgi:hypothetical protein